MSSNHLIQLELAELECFEKCDRTILENILLENQRNIGLSRESYYNQAEDEYWIEQYYCHINANDSSPSQLFHDLHQLVASTHMHPQPYYRSKDEFLYTWVDLYEDGMLRGIYSNQQKRSIDVMSEDYENVRKRFRTFRELTCPQDDPLHEYIHISRQYRYNTEHVVPQSWFGGQEPMKGDLHHLFTCEPACNSARANYPYYDYTYRSKSESDSIQNSCGNYEVGRFEPLHGKGTVARATFYFFLRYPDQVLKKYRRRVDFTLLQHWNEQYSVTRYEQHRNKAIFEIQGNRNPFIDYPEWVDSCLSIFLDLAR